jgi:accessory gene regulator B
LVELGSVSEDEKDICEYGFLLIASLAINLLVTVAIGFAFAIPLEMLAMFIPFAALRAVSGGYHAKSFGGCVAVSAVSIAGAIAAIRFTPETARFLIAVGLSAFTLATVFTLAPLRNINRPFDGAEMRKFRKLSRITVIGAIAVSQVLFLTRVPLYGFSISTGIALSGAATLVAALRERGGEHDEEEV